MKKLFIILMLIPCILLSSCSYKKINKEKKVSKVITENKDGLSKRINFSEVDINSLSENYKNFINKIKGQKGYYFYKYNDDYYIAIFAGKKNTGGYEISVDNIKLKDKTLEIIIKEKSPDPKLNVIQVITYPYTIIRVKGDDYKIIVKDINGAPYNYVSSEKGAAIY